MEQLEQIIFQLISNSGSAKSSAFAAFEAIKNNDLDKARKLLQKASEEILAAHQAQTELIQKEANGENIELNILMVHAQDHLMTAMLAKELIEKMIDMQIEINRLKEEI